MNLTEAGIVKRPLLKCEIPKRIVSRTKAIGEYIDGFKSIISLPSGKFHRKSGQSYLLADSSYLNIYKKSFSPYDINNFTKIQPELTKLFFFWWFLCLCTLGIKS